MSGEGSGTPGTAGHSGNTVEGLGVLNVFGGSSVDAGTLSEQTPSM